MNWKQWLTFNPYKKAWSLIGGRPWTFISRDFWNSAEIVMQALWFWTAILILHLLGVSIPVKTLLVGWAIYTYGYVNGHIFWGTDWKKGEKGD